MTESHTTRRLTIMVARAEHSRPTDVMRTAESMQAVDDALALAAKSTRLLKRTSTTVVKGTAVSRHY